MNVESSIRCALLALLPALAIVGSIAGNASPVLAEQVKLDFAATYPTLLAGDKQLNYLRVGLTGFDMPSAEKRPPVNVAIVLDKSGSMQGDKIEQAKNAAVEAVGRLSDEDIVSIVVYDNGVNVLVPATKASDRDMIVAEIQKIAAHGGTALFAGVSKGAAELRKFKSDDQVNRVILLSDGLANVGPSSSAELTSLGESLLKEGISVTTLGLGLNYNEDLMTGLASASNGNHAFIENAQDLVGVFNNEFDDLLSVVATDFEIQIEVKDGVRPVRVLGSNADIDGARITLPLAQLYAKQLRYFMIEIEVQPGEMGTTRDLASASVKYKNLQTETEDRLSSDLQVRFTDSKQQVSSDTNGEALAYCTLQLTTLRNRQATELADAGQVDAAKKLLELNMNQLLKCKTDCADKLSVRTLDALDFGISGNSTQAETVVDSKNWNANRKGMRQYQNAIQQQQTYTGDGKIGSGGGDERKP